MDNVGDPDIRFDEQGVSNYWTEAEAKKPKFQLSESESAEKQRALVEMIKKEGKGKEYDCLIGLSGGVDSSYVAVWAKENGLRPLAVHFDNGWNSEIAVSNIKNICDKLDIELYTYVVDWEEFLDLQRAFIKASVVDIEMLTDNSHKAVSLSVAKEFGIKYLLSGANFATENIMPPSWNWNKQDLTNIKAIHKQFGERPMKSYKSISQTKWLFMKYTSMGLHYLTPLNLINFRKSDAMEELKEKVGWKYYGGKHYESVWTKFYQAYILPTKFNIDKRKIHLSSLILNKEISREEALLEMSKPLYNAEELKRDRQFVLKKLKFSEAEFEKIMAKPRVPHDHYASDIKYRNAIKKIVTTLGIHKS